MRYHYLFLISLCGLGRLFAQTYNFRTYAEDQGLPHTYVYCITQTPEGYLYLSTGEGLTVFDGNKFTTFTTREIAGNLVTTHFTDSRRISWVGHLQNGVSYIKNNGFNELKNTQLEKVKVTMFAEDRHRNLWISTQGGGLFMVDSSMNLKNIDCPPAEYTNSMHFDPAGRLVLATASGLYLLDVSNPAAVKIVCEVPEFKGKIIRQLAPVNETGDRYWLHVEGEGVYGIKQTRSCFRIFAHLLQELQSEKNNIACIYSDKSEDLWVSLFGEGLRKVVFNGAVEAGDFSVFKIDRDNGLKNLYVQSILEDFEGNMWFGTFGGGLIEKPVEKFSFYGRKDGLRSADVKKIVIDARGGIWTAHEDGVAFFDPETYNNIVYNHSMGFTGGEVSALCLDSKNLLWIGTRANGVYRFDNNTGKFEHVSETYHLSPSSINAITESRGEVVIATDEGICIIDQRTGHTQVYTTSDGLLHNNLINVYYDSKRRLWVSSHGAPPYYIQNGKVQTIKNIKGLSSFNLNAVVEDKEGRIWIASEGDGVFMYDGKTCTNYRIKQGLTSNYCYGIATDGNNSIWVSHKNGLSEKKPGDNSFRAISSATGLLFAENNLNAIGRDNNGDLWFGTTEGIVHYNAETGKKNITEPKLSLLEVKLNDVTYTPGEEIRVAYGYYSAHISFLAISLSNPENIQYKYRLLDIDSSWRYTDQRFVDYPNLADGTYTFEVHACNSEGLWTQQPVRVSFTIREPVWKKVWFYLLLIALVVSVTYVIIVWRTQNLKRSQMLLKIKVKQKTYLLQREKEEVEKIKTELENKNKDILDSIAYARRIQDSLLPPDETLGDLFDENYFIFYRPKDIVSGDFYWAARVELDDEKSRTLSLAAVADCTGHGVPGAFLSIVASSFLKQSLTEKFVTNTGDVLDYLNKNITATLNQSSKTRKRISDGMDLSIIAIDYKHNRLHYAGANNPIYIYRKAENGTQLFILKPTKQAIGTVPARQYESQIFDLQAGDSVYMFSDGYADQFGGEKDKKFNYRRFREALGHASEMPMSLQRGYLEQRFEEWKGSGSQTDDVCIMGLKI